MMAIFVKNQRADEQGFTLVEIMVAMIIGLLGVIIIMQVFATFEGRKRTTTGGNDAQNSGVIALYSLQRDTRQAGYGINSPNLIGCGLKLASGVIIPLAPVTINSPLVAERDDNTDSLLVIYGNSGSASEGMAFEPVSGMPSKLSMTTAGAFQVNDTVIAEPAIRPATCLLNAGKAAAVEELSLSLDAAPSPAIANGNLYNLGDSPKVLAYRVRGGNLTVCDYLVSDCSSSAVANWTPIGDNIVSLRAQYGVDTNSPRMDGFFDEYNQTTPTDASGNYKTNCGWLRISSLRLVLVARSAQPETEKTATGLKEVTSDELGNTPGWEGQATLPIDLSNTVVPTGFTWKNFRYKEFQTIVPLRNISPMLVAAKAAGC